ncbi:MAG: squalene-hopene/tetraprenyl-beta-curcumene cyclase, partial [Planctomycetota bacterium]
REASREASREGCWEGKLSSSALSTATAVGALAVVSRARSEQAGRLRTHIDAGIAWLAANANADGGYGDTVESPTNISTTVLAWMAFVSADQAELPAALAARTWIERALGGLDAERLASGLAQVYGDDHTFAVPILTSCAIAGCLDSMWPTIPRLPFELAAFPRALFRFLGLPVVSYALPALIAIGQAQHHNYPTRNPITRVARALVRGRTLRVLGAIQPEGGGYLEATPLTSFVVMSLVGAGEQNLRVVDHGLEFLEASIRNDGSWPIDTNLSTWVTTLSIGALAGGDRLEKHLSGAERSAMREWLLGQQLKGVHPYTGAAPGGWAWTNLPGGVPDADDTASALLALHALGDESNEVVTAARAGVTWLLDLANRDGGTPTFCRGWGLLPFDQSSADLTAHSLRAFAAWEGVLGDALRARVSRASSKARAFLCKSQRPDGAWIPLWFGSQREENLENPLYGTSRVLRACDLRGGDEAWRESLTRAAAWLLGAQGEEGGFGASQGLEPSIEETGMGLEALGVIAATDLAPRRQVLSAMENAGLWLAEATSEGTRFPATPIGLYFARLWYSERLYPIVYTVAALERARAVQ